MDLTPEQLAEYRIDTNLGYRKEPSGETGTAINVVHMMCASDLHIPGGFFPQHVYLGELLHLVAEHAAACAGRAPTSWADPAHDVMGDVAAAKARMDKERREWSRSYPGPAEPA